MENRAYALAAGLFVLVLGAALVAGVLWLNRDERVGGVPYEVTTTRPVSGLKVEAPVRFRGVDVGNIAMRPSLFDSGEGVVTAFGEVAERINKLLADDNQKVLMSTLARIDAASARAAKLADSLEPGVKAIAPLLADTRAAVNDARGTVKRAEEMVAAITTLAAKLEERSVALGQLGDNAGDVGAAARALNDETLPRLNALADELRREARALDRVLTGLADQPNSLVFGASPRRPGPGEAGFDARR